MKSYLQFGHGMMSIAEQLIGEWGDGGVLLSPRDLDEAQLGKVSSAVSSRGGEVLLDPQCYVHAADHPRLTSYPYWQRFRENKTSDLITTGNFAVLEALFDLNRSVKTESVILPGLFAESISEEWWDFHEAQIARASGLGDGRTIVPTIAISAALATNEAAIDEIAERAGKWAIDRIYFVAESTGSYLADAPMWLYGVLALVAGLKLRGKEVIVGYANHQLLSLTCVAADAFASGTWLNVRAFPPEKFRVSEEDEMSRRAKGGWYYCPQALSEYKMVALDVANSKGVLGEMYPDPDTGYVGPLFTGVQPTLVNWGERNAFCHYLSALRSQAAQFPKLTYDETLAAQREALHVSQKFNQSLRNKGVRGNDRDFSDYFDVSFSALDLLDGALGPRLRRSWSSL